MGMGSRSLSRGGRSPSRGVSVRGGFCPGACNNRSYASVVTGPLVFVNTILYYMRNARIIVIDIDMIFYTTISDVCEFQNSVSYREGQQVSQ